MPWLLWVVRNLLISMTNSSPTTLTFHIHIVDTDARTDVIIVLLTH